MVTGTYIGVFLQPIIVVSYGFAQGSIKPRVRFHIPLTMQPSCPIIMLVGTAEVISYTGVHTTKPKLQRRKQYVRSYAEDLSAVNG